MFYYYLLLLFVPVFSDKPHEILEGLLGAPACSTLKRFCTNPQENDDLSVLECFHQLNPKDFDTTTKDCQQLIWETTTNLTKDENILKILMPVCKHDFETLNCNKDEGEYLKCLATNRDNIEDRDCEELTKRIENIAFTDYKFLAKFLKHCESDVKKLNCGIMDSQGLTQMSTIVCLQNNILKVNNLCEKEVLRLSQLQSDNIKLDHQLYMDCMEDYSRYCSQFHEGSGRIFHCLTRQEPDKLRSKCKTSIFRRQSLISQDYRISKGLIRSCRDEIKRTHCRKQTSNDKTVRLAQILLCLENVHKNGSKVSSDCEAELMEHRRMLMEDYRLSPEIVNGCKKETLNLCKGYETGGKTIHCLMKHARSRLMIFGKECLQALEDLLKNANAAENWKVDPILQKACSPVVQTVCKDIVNGHGRVMNCLMNNVGTDHMTDDCEDALIQIQYFVARRFELDDQLYHACKVDAEKICQYKGSFLDNNINNREILPCLYRYIDPEDGTIKLSKNCLDNLRRIMRQRAISVDLEPEIEEKCFRDLGTFCHDRAGVKGEEMRCLQEKYHDLDDENCKNTIRMFTEFQSEHAELNYYVNKFCPKIIDTLCNQEAKNDQGDIMDCLITHKNDQLVRNNAACRGSIEHFQIISLNDYRFSYKFKIACKNYAIRFCSKAKTKNDVVRCLSEQVLNSTINGVKGQIPKECKQQLKAQLFQQRENTKLDPILKDACGQDIQNYCGNVPNENAQVLECLQTMAKKLTETCEKEIFRIKKQEVFDNTVDYSLNTMCANAIEQFCPHHEKENIFECLKAYRDKPGFDKKCRSIINHRIVQQNSNYQLNPLLQQNCIMDINKFCKKDLLTLNASNNKNGVVINCLKEQFKLSRLTNKCEKEVATILREQALNINLNPLIRTLCKNELQTICKSASLDQDNDDDAESGDTEECLKDALLNSRIQTPECKIEIANMIAESQADIQVDPLLQKVCALDLLQFCSEIPQGNGRHVNCLRIKLEQKNDSLSPKCKNMLKKRLEMYKNAALLYPAGSAPESLHQLYDQMTESPAKHYFLVVLMMIFGSIFIGGLLCGKLNNRRYMLLKTK